MKLLFIDFEDSFTNNILSYLNQDFDLEVKNFQELVIDDLVDANIILGPGPGHPNEYIEYFNEKGLLLSRALKQARRILGICLGHQIVLSELYGASIIRSKFPMHGRGVRALNSITILDLELGECLFQRYNSLTVVMNKSGLNSPQVILDENNEILMTYVDNKLLTMQVHPESVGTSCSKSIFQAITSFFM